MIYYCADDYGISVSSNRRIEMCLDGALNKISILPNGEATDFKHLTDKCSALTLHLNLVEGYPLSELSDVSLLVSEQGCFKYSFVGLFALSVSPKRKKLEKQVYNEIRKQLDFIRNALGENTPLYIDSHQHTHMIPWIFKVLMRVIKDNGINVKYLRFPAEPVMPYIMTPSLYFSYSPAGLIKQWLLKFLGLINRKEFKKSKIPTGYFLGVLFSGNVNEKRISKILPHYIKLAEKKGADIEIGLHPGYIEKSEKLMKGCRKGFEIFYHSPLRRIEFDTLMKL